MSLEYEFNHVNECIEEAKSAINGLEWSLNAAKERIETVIKFSHRVPKTADEIEAELRESISARISANTREEIIKKMVKVLVGIEVHKIITEYDRKMYDAHKFDVFDCVSKALNYIRDAMIKEITTSQNEERNTNYFK